MTSSPNSLIMGVAAGYTNNLIMPFLKSLRATSYAGRVCLFVGGISEDAITELKTLADDVILLDGIYGAEIEKHHLRAYAQWLAKVRVTRRVRRLYPALFRAALRRAGADRRIRLRLDLEQCLEGFQSLRYQHYLDYLESHAPNADFVMISDVRDVIFQDDPFSHHFKDELEVFLEASHVTIGNEPFDRRWMLNLYGKERLHSFIDRNVSCSGTTMGTQKGLYRYLNEMIAQVRGQERPLGSHDQGIHNYLLWEGRLNPVTIYPNGTGPVLTLGLEKIISRDTEGRLLNHDGGIAPVVHQYDRHPGLAQELWQKFG